MPFESSCSWISNCCLFDLGPYFFIFIEVLFCFKKRVSIDFRAFFCLFVYQHAHQLSAPLGSLVVQEMFLDIGTPLSAVKLAPAWLLRGSGSLGISMGQGLFPGNAFRAATCFNHIHVVLWQLTLALGGLLGYVSHSCTVDSQDPRDKYSNLLCYYSANFCSPGCLNFFHFRGNRTCVLQLLSSKITLALNF